MAKVELSAHELAHALLELPDLPVRMEGCDCYQSPARVYVESGRADGDAVFIDNTMGVSS